MPTSHRKFAAAFVIVVLTAAAVALVVDGDNPVAAFIADMAGNDDGGPADAAGSPSRLVARRSRGRWPIQQAEDADDPDATAWLDPAIHPLRVRLVDANQAPVGGVPVFVLGAGEGGPVLAGPKTTNADGRVRFPIDLAMEQEHDVVVAARAVPGRAATAPAKVALDRESEVTLTIDAGIRASIQVLDPEGRSVNAVARVRRAILDDGAVETGPRADLLTRVFSETTPRALRRPAGFELVGLRTPDDLGLIVSAPGFAPVYTTVRVPAQALSHRSRSRSSSRRGRASCGSRPAYPSGLDKDQAAFSCHRVETPGSSSRREATRCRPSAVPASRSRCLRTTRSGSRSSRGSTAGSRLPARSTCRPCERARFSRSDRSASRCSRSSSPGASSTRTKDRSPTRRSKPSAWAGSAISRRRPDADGGFALRAPAGRGPYQVSAHAAGRVSEKVAGVSDPALGPPLHARAKRIDPGPRGPVGRRRCGPRVGESGDLPDGRRSSRRFNPTGRSSSAAFRAACTR